MITLATPLRKICRLAGGAMMCFWLSQAQAQFTQPEQTQEGNSQQQPDQPSKPSVPIKYTGKGSAIVDDSTKNIYGPKTALWIREKDLFENKVEYKRLDTAILNYHRWTHVQAAQYYYQDLGNNGTAMNRIVPLAESSIGVGSGFSAYMPYYHSEELKYFNTKSPYTTFKLVWAGKGRAMSKIEFSRNITPRWNIGFNYRPILTDKQILRRQKGDRQVISHYYDFYTSFFSKNQKYSLLAHYRRMRHQVRENGGIVFSSPTESLDAYYKDDVTPGLTAAATIAYRRNYHFYHQYEIAKQLQIYQSADFDKETYSFSDDRNAEVHYNNMFKETYVIPGTDSIKVSDFSIFNSQSTQAGVKGSISKFFYAAYYKARYYSFNNKFVAEYDLPIPQKGSEHSLGGRLDIHIDSTLNFSGETEYLNTGRYRLAGKIASPWFDVRVKSILAKPSFLATNYKGTHNFWIQKFNDTFTNQLEGDIKLRLWKFNISPGLTYTAFTNRIYYKRNGDQESARPFQAGGTQQLAVVRLKINFPISKKFAFSAQTDYNELLQNADQAIQVPKIFINGQIAYQYYMFKKAIFVHAGFDAHWQSGYYAMQYDPAIQQFYVQTQYKTPSFFILDAFLNAQFKRGRAFLKYHNILQMAALKQSLYMPTPQYRGVGSIIDFGFDLILFN